MRFHKMHGAGNDYVFVETWTQKLPQPAEELAVQVSSRHTGIGADGLICLGPSPMADARMEMWNADGSRGAMCGNGLRCAAKLLYEQRLIHRVLSSSEPVLNIETDVGVRTARLMIEEGCVDHVKLNMGEPLLTPQEIPVSLAGPHVLEHPLNLRETELKITCVSMGNPHAIVFVDRLDDGIVERYGPAMEHHPLFPDRVNVEFVQVQHRSRLRMRVWERGSGETLACGSGACAAVVASVLTGRTQRRVQCDLPGGVLDIEWSDTGDVLLTGPAVEVFRGEWSAKMPMPLKNGKPSYAPRAA